MKNKEQLPKFNLEFGFLENPEILKLQRLFDDTTGGEDEEIRGKTLVALQKRWSELLEKYSEEAKADKFHLKQLLQFFRYNMGILDKGGMLLGRSKIGIFMSAENEKLINRFGNLVGE